VERPILRNDPWLCFMSFGTGIGKLTIEGPPNEQMWDINGLTIRQRATSRLIQPAWEHRSLAKDTIQ
jgi:hypothetical protein